MKPHHSVSMIPDIMQEIRRRFNAVVIGAPRNRRLHPLSAAYFQYQRVRLGVSALIVRAQTFTLLHLEMTHARCRLVGRMATTVVARTKLELP